MQENYSWITQVAVETIDPEVVGLDWLDQWLHHVQLSLNDGGSGYGGTGYRRDLTTEPFIELCATKGNEPIDTRLLVAPLADGLAVFLGGCDADPDQEACDAWIVASHEATTSLEHLASTSSGRHSLARLPLGQWRRSHGWGSPSESAPSFLARNQTMSRSLCLDRPTHRFLPARPHPGGPSWPRVATWATPGQQRARRLPSTCTASAACSQWPSTCVRSFANPRLRVRGASERHRLG